MGIITIILLIIAMICSAVSIIVSIQLLYAETPFQHGYEDGLSDGKASAHDVGPSCEKYNSTSANECSHGYEIGFKLGCKLEGNKLPYDPYPEYGRCIDYK